MVFFWVLSIDYADMVVAEKHTALRISFEDGLQVDFGLPKKTSEKFDVFYPKSAEFVGFPMI